MPSYTLAELAERYELQAVGDAGTVVDGVCSLSPGRAGGLSFLSNPRFRTQLGSTQASIVLLRQADLESLKGAGLIAKDPYLAYARIAALFDPEQDFTPGISAQAAVAGDAVLGAGCHIGPMAVIESGVVLGAGVFIGAGCVIGRDARIAAGTRLVAQVHIGARVQIGERCVIQPGAVIGARGFGNAIGPRGWEAVPQLGSVRIGNDVEVGAHTCIDRGAIEDTVIEDGVRLDNLIQIAHNCRIGAHTAIAACTGIAGSTVIGRRCMIGGAVGITGHVEIADDVVLLAGAMVTNGIKERGAYGSVSPLEPAQDWRKTVARVRRLGKLETRLRAVEAQLRPSEGLNNDDDNDPN